MPGVFDLPERAWEGPRKLLERVRPDRVAAGVERQLFTTRVLVDTGFIAPMRPDKIARMVRLLQRWGFTPASAIAVSLVTFRERTSRTARPIGPDDHTRA